jgi:predicted ArsR family transcriptional regulator
MQATLGAESTMDRTERFYRIELLIRSRGSVTFAALMEDLEVSRATLKRDLEYLRTRLDAPIVYDRDSNGYRFQQGARRAARGGRKARWPQRTRPTSCRGCGSASARSAHC